MAASGAETDRVITDTLNGLLALWTANNVAMRIQLFTNNNPVTNASLLTDFVLAAFAGGGAVALTAGQFGAAAVNAHVAQTTGPLCTWVNNGAAAAAVWGYVVFDNGNQTLMWAENFGAAQSIAPGGAFTVQPSLKDQSAYF